MGEKVQEALKLRFDRRLRLEFRGVRIASDACLLACRDRNSTIQYEKKDICIKNFVPV